MADSSNVPANESESPCEGLLESSETLEKRKRIPTERGREYMLSLKETNYRKEFERLKHKIDELDMLWTEISVPDELRKERSEIERLRTCLEQAMCEYAALLPEEVSSKFLESAAGMLKEAQDLRKKVGERIFELERDEIRSRVSSKSSSHRSQKGSRHSTGQASNPASVASISVSSSVRRMNAISELAKREVEYKFAKAESKIKLELQQKECEMEEIRRAKEYERAKAEADAIVNSEEFPVDMFDNTPVKEEELDERVEKYLVSLQSFEDGERAEAQSSQDRPDTRPVHSTYVIKTDPDEQPPRVENSNSQGNTRQERPQDVAEIIAESLQTARMPPPVLSTFSGNPIDWPMWKTSFETVIERKTISSSEKILYLLQYLSGPPRKMVEGYQFVSSPSAYQEAKQALEKRFGHPSVVADAFRSRLETWPKINPRDGNALREYADFLKTCELAAKSIDDLETLNKEHENKKLLKALPSWALPKWGSRVRDFQLKHGLHKFPNFSTFVHFVAELAEVQCLPVLSTFDASQVKEDKRDKSSRPRANPVRKHGASTLATDATDAKPSQSGPSCKWCKSELHELHSCQEFRKKHLSARKQFVMKKGLCFKCLEHGHTSKENKCTKRLKCATCEQEHPTCLHIDHKPQPVVENVDNGETASSNCTNVCMIEGQDAGEDQSLIVPVWASSFESPDVECLTYAMLDCQSNATFITEKLRRELKIEGVESCLSLSTMHGENETIMCQKLKGVVVKNLEGDVSIPVPKLFTKESIPFKSSQIPKPEVALQWSHLEGIASKLMPYRADIEVGMLIGTNCPKAIKPREVLPGSDDDPYGIRTDLGWGIVGRVCKSPLKDADEEQACTHRTMMSEQLTLDQEEKLPSQGTRFAVESRYKEVFTPAHVQEMFEMDFHEKSEKNGAAPQSVEDRQFLEIMNKGIHQRHDGHYEMPLPFRSQNV